MKNIVATGIILIAFLWSYSSSSACTSMIISAEKSASGRPLLWKHRDTGADNNFIARVEPTDSTAGYVGLFNAGDSLLAEAWMGMNDRGFAIMNTASYNVPDLESELEDREAAVMTEALKHCTTVADFEALLERLPKPLGVQTNFGVIDSRGGAAYFETSDRQWVRFDVADAPQGYLIRTNHSLSGKGENGMGYIRYATAEKLAGGHQGLFKPTDLTEGFSRQFYHSLIDRDMTGDSIIVDRDFIPRDISTSSLVVEGIAPGGNAEDISMWGCLGYPPCGISDRVTLTDIPAGFMPTGPGWRSEECDRAMERRKKARPMPYPEGAHYLDMTVLRPIIEECIARSLANFHNHPK